MNAKHRLFAVFFTGLMVCLSAVQFCRLNPEAHAGWMVVWGGGGVGCVIMMLAVWFRRDKVADVLSRMGVRYLERDGLCFAMLPVVEAGRARLVVLYQNRYDTPCTATIMLRPSHKDGQANMRRLRFNVSCPGNGVGQDFVDWPIPQELQGQRVTFLVGADVIYPRGRGRLMRFKDGLRVGSITEVENSYLQLAFSERTTLTLVAPTGVASEPGAMEQAPQGMEAEPAPHKETGCQPVSSPKVEGKQLEVRMPTMEPPTKAALAALDDHHVAAAIASMSDLASRRAHERRVERMKRGQLSAQASAILGAGVCGILLLGYGILGRLNDWPLPWKHVAIIAGGLFSALAILGMFGLVAQWLIPFELKAPAAVLETCRTYYRAALTSFKNSDADFVAVCNCLSGSALQPCEASAVRLKELLRAWSEVREQHVAEDAACQVEEIVVAEEPRDNVDAVDVVVSLRGPRIGRLAFRNVAVRADQRWYLVSAEPIAVHRGDEPKS